MFASSPFSSESVSLRLSQTTAADLLSWCNEGAVERQLFVCRQGGSLFIHQHLPQGSPMSLGEPFYGKHCSVQMLLHPSKAIILRNPETLKLHHFKSQVFLSSVCDLMIKTPKENEHPEISSSSKIRSDCAVWKALGSPGFP